MKICFGLVLAAVVWLLSASEVQAQRIVVRGRNNSVAFNQGGGGGFAQAGAFRGGSGRTSFASAGFNGTARFAGHAHHHARGFVGGYSYARGFGFAGYSYGGGYARVDPCPPVVSYGYALAPTVIRQYTPPTVIEEQVEVPVRRAVVTYVDETEVRTIRRVIPGSYSYGLYP